MRLSFAFMLIRGLGCGTRTAPCVFHISDGENHQGLAPYLINQKHTLRFGADVLQFLHTSIVDAPLDKIAVSTCVLKCS